MKASEKIVELSNKELIRMAPSVGQTKPYIASDKYSFIPTINAIDWLRDAGWKPVSASQSMVRDKTKDGFQKHMVRFTKPDLVMNGTRADVLLFNSHDSSAVYRTMLGFFEFVCANGLITGDEIGQYSYRHIGFDPDLFISNTEKLIGIADEKGSLIEDWKGIELTPDERGIFTQAATESLYNGLQTFEPEQLLELRRKEDKENTLWKTYNTVQENLIRGGLVGKSANGRSTVTREIVSLDRDRAINQTLWQISANMHEIKTAA